MNEYRPPLSYRVRRAVDNGFRRIGELGATLMAPIDAVFRFVSRRFFAASEGLEQIDSLLVGITRLLTWPFRLTWRLLVGLTGLVAPPWLRTAVAAPFVHSGAAWRRVKFGAWELIERLNLDAPVLGLVWVTQPFWRPVAAVAGFLYAWLVTRTYRQFLWGLPALLLFLPVASVALWGAFGHSESIAEQYRVAVAAARDEQDYDRMQLFERKLVQLGVDTDRTNYGTALSLEDEGKLDEAYERMKELAPEDEPKYFLAHHWILMKLLNQQLDVPAEDRIRLAGVHLQHMKTLGARGKDIDLLHAIWLRQNGQLEEAANMLAPLMARVEFAAIQRLEIDLALHRLDEARRDARAVRDHMRDVKRRGERMDVQQFAAWAKSEELLGDQIALAEVLREWLAAFPDDPLARQNVASLNLREFNEIVRSPVAIPQELTTRLIELARLSPNPSELDPLVTSLYEMQSQSAMVAEHIAQLIQATKADDAPLPLVAALGTAAALNGDIELARRLLARVVAADPSHAVAWNNYAWTLSQEPGRDLDAALNAVDRALQLKPEEFRFRETRGQILVALGQWQRAIDDLEFAINGMPDAAAIHLSLAKAYEQLGNQELADIHRAQVP
jgi:predicted Zn-dependent protease